MKARNKGIAEYHPQMLKNMHEWEISVFLQGLVDVIDDIEDRLAKLEKK